MSLHEYPDVIQGTDEWLDLRRGVVTASAVGRLISVGSLSAVDYICPSCGSVEGEPCYSLKAIKGAHLPIKTLHPERVAFAEAKRDTSPPVIKPSTGDEARRLTLTLVAERITGWTEPSYVNDDMMRGNLCEPIARDAYSEHYAPAVEMGFMRRDEDGWSLGFSPDGLVNDVSQGPGLIEIKAPRAKEHIRTILADEVPPQYMAQCQAGLLVTGREWLDFVSFHGGLPLYVKRVLPSPTWFDAITAAVEQFEETAAEMVAAYAQVADGLPATRRIDLDLEIRI